MECREDDIFSYCVLASFIPFHSARPQKIIAGKATVECAVEAY